MFVRGNTTLLIIMRGGVSQMLNLAVMDFKEGGNETNKSGSYQKAGQVIEKAKRNLKSIGVVSRG